MESQAWRTVKIRVKDAEVGLAKIHSMTVDEALSIEGLDIGLLGVEKGVGRNWRQWKTKEVYLQKDNA